MAALRDTNQLPSKDTVVNSSGIISRTWEVFFRYIKSALDPLGVEKSVQIDNHVTIAAPLKGLFFDSGSISHAIVEFLIQRVKLGVSGSQLIEAGSFQVAYKPYTEAWSKFANTFDGPDDTGVDFSITSAGQVEYTSTNFASGAADIERVIYRVRTLSGKSHFYSKMGTGNI